MTDAKHPMLIQFSNKLKSGPTKLDVESFDKWRQGAKCPPGPVREAADALWRQYQEQGAKTVHVPLVRQPQASGRPGAAGGRRQEGGGSQLGDNRDAASASLLVSAFHNPYTFLPFPEKPPERKTVTPLSIDEGKGQGSRRTGVLKLTICTMSPLMSCSPSPVRSVSSGGTEHKVYHALRVGKDPIVPATGIRGALRTLMTVLTGGTLGYIDRSLWLTQGRDMSLGPRSKKAPNPQQPSNCFLARVERAGSSSRSGTICLGRTKLVPLSDLENLLGEKKLSEYRPTSGRTSPLFVDESLTRYGNGPTRETPWQVKLSGRPVNTKGKQEAIFLASESPKDLIALPPELWAQYLGRHQHGVIDGVHTGDLLWLEPTDREAASIRDAQDIASLQWSRWGRRGEALESLIKKHHAGVLPDNLRRDGLVDAVTDLFGQVPLEENSAGAFSARVRPENLVFAEAKTEGPVALAPLAPPHPGCAAFYRDSDDLDQVANRALPLRGYKVYRTTKETGPMAPWHYASQPVFDEGGSPKPQEQNVNKSAELVPAGSTGTLRIAFRGLSARELALLLLACCVDWRLGGGKPLGLGHCKVTGIEVVDEFGTLHERLAPDCRGANDLPEHLRPEVAGLESRVHLWLASQAPVDLLRYPRAVEPNNNGIQRGGHAWFKRHADPRKGRAGLEVLWLQGNLEHQAKSKKLRAQSLPRFDPRNPSGDALHGYDLIPPRGSTTKTVEKKTLHGTLEPFDPGRHVTGRERSGGSQTPGAKEREQERRRRGEDRRL